MNKRVEIVMNAEAAETDRMDFNGLCREMGLRWFSFQEDLPGQKGQSRQSYFVYETGLDTGVKFNRKLDMQTEIQLYWSSRRVHGTALITWAGVRGHRILSTRSAEERAERDRARAVTSARLARTLVIAEENSAGPQTAAA